MKRLSTIDAYQNYIVLSCISNSKKTHLKIKKKKKLQSHFLQLKTVRSIKENLNKMKKGFVFLEMKIYQYCKIQCIN